MSVSRAHRRRALRYLAFKCRWVRFWDFRFQLMCFLILGTGMHSESSNWNSNSFRVCFLSGKPAPPKPNELKNEHHTYSNSFVTQGVLSQDEQRSLWMYSRYIRNNKGHKQRGQRWEKENLPKDKKRAWAEAKGPEAHLILNKIQELGLEVLA